MSRAIFGIKTSMVWTLPSSPASFLAVLHFPSESEDRLNNLPRLVPRLSLPAAPSPQRPCFLPTLGNFCSALGSQHTGVCFSRKTLCCLAVHWAPFPSNRGPVFPWTAVLHPLTVPSVCTLSLSLQPRSRQQLCDFPQPTSGPARVAPSSWRLPRARSLGPGPSFLLAVLASVPV